jgi:hypothetical protein
MRLAARLAKQKQTPHPAQKQMIARDAPVLNGQYIVGSAKCWLQ